MFTLVGGLALVLPLGRLGVLYEAFYHAVPLWSAFRYPEKFIGLVTFSTALLAGAGFDALRKGQGRAEPWFLVARVCAGFGGGLLTENASKWAALQFGVPEDLAGDVTGSTAAAFLVSAATTFGVWLIVLAARQGRLREVAVAVALVGIVAVDLASANIRAYHTGPRDAAVFIPTLAEAIKAREGRLAPGRFRLFAIHEASYVWPKKITELLGYHGAESVHLCQSLATKINAEFDIETFRPNLPGFSPALEAMALRAKREALARLNVRYLVGHQSRLEDPELAKGLLAVLPEYDLALFRNPIPVKPRAYLSRRPERMVGPVEIGTLLARSDFLSGEVDVIEAPDTTLPGPAESGQATIERTTPEEVRVRVETPRPAVLVLLDTYDVGWRATLENGDERFPSCAPMGS